MKFFRGCQLLAAVMICLAAEANTAAVAQMFFADPTSGVSFFGGLGDVEQEQRPRVIIRSSRHSQPIIPRTQTGFCVRSCDGRFFPISQPGADTKSCQALCPTAEMSMFSGSAIDDAQSEQGKPYKSLANAFRFQRELVPSCSCNLKTATGMTPISVRNDLTLRSGDIIAEEEGFSVATVSGGRAKHRSAGITFRPLTASKVKALGLAQASMR